MITPFFYRSVIAALIYLLVITLAGCRPETEIPVTRLNSLTKLSQSQYPKFRDDLDRESLKQSIRQSLIYFSRLPETRQFHFGADQVDLEQMRSSLELLLSFFENNTNPGALNAFIRENYLVYRSVGSKETNDMLFTGYYEPSLEGSLTREPDYPHPLFSKPDDLLTVNLRLFSERFKGEGNLTARVNEKNRVVPYYTRKEINEIDDFSERATPVVWVKNRTERFFLEIQGSGRVQLKQGGELRVHYHTKNGHPYRPIGRYLIHAGEITKEAMSMQAIRQWLDKNPERAEDVFNYNPSFVFFKPEESGPLGSIGVQVTPMRSIATDNTLFPKGSLCFMETALPSTQSQEPPEEWKPQSGFVLNQDRGGAIKGPGRVDLFFGHSSYAEYGAGHMKHPGRLYFLVLKP